jgi:ABC-type lipoprotein release transport system permease subunit
MAAQRQAQQLRIAGTVAASGAPVAVMDIGALQQKLGLFDRIDRLDLLLTDSASRSQVATALHALPAWQDQILIQQPSDDQQRVGEMSRAYRVNLTVLALVALFTGAFLVFSVLALSVAQRAPQFALLAVLGATPRQRMALVLLEALALGTLGSLAGIALGCAGLAGAAGAGRRSGRRLLCRRAARPALEPCGSAGLRSAGPCRHAGRSLVARTRRHGSAASGHAQGTGQHA